MTSVTTPEGRQALQAQGITGAVTQYEFKIDGGKITTTESLEQWIRDPVKVLNAWKAVTAPVSKMMFETVRFQGFDKMEFIKSWTVDHGLSATTMVKVAFIAAVRGTNIERVKEAIASDALNIPQNGTLISLLDIGAKTTASADKRATAAGRKAITIARCATIVPHIVAAMMKSAEVPARYPGLACPPHLQFPAAGSLPLNETTRAQHKEFSNRFSQAISQGRKDTSTRQETIYAQQVASGIHPLTMPAWVAEALKNDITTESYTAATTTPA